MVFGTILDCTDFSICPVIYGSRESNIDISIFIFLNQTIDNSRNTLDIELKCKWYACNDTDV